MRLFVFGSVPLLSEPYKQWQAANAIIERYGMTETNMNTSNPYDGERRAGAVGFSIQNVEIRIISSATGGK